MNKLEVVSSNGTAEIPILDKPDELIDGLNSVVANGIVDPFDDVAWLYYYGPFEKMTAQSDHGLQALWRHIQSLGFKPKSADRSHLEVLACPNKLARNMAKVSGNGGGFYRISSLDEQRYVAVPAIHVPHTLDQPQAEVTIDIAHGISFAGTALVEALFNSGFMPEIIDYREEPHFPAYRTAMIGEFFVKHTLST